MKLNINKAVKTSDLGGDGGFALTVTEPAPPVTQKKKGLYSRINESWERWRIHPAPPPPPPPHRRPYKS